MKRLEPTPDTFSVSGTLLSPNRRNCHGNLRGQRYQSVSFCLVYWENEDHSQQPDGCHSRKCRRHGGGGTGVAQGPKGTLQRDFNHINVELSLLGKKRGPELANGGEIGRKRPGFARAELLVCEEYDKGVPLASATRGRLWAHFPISAAVQKNGSLVEI